MLSNTNAFPISPTLQNHRQCLSFFSSRSQPGNLKEQNSWISIDIANYRIRRNNLHVTRQSSMDPSPKSNTTSPTAEAENNDTVASSDIAETTVKRENASPNTTSTIPYEFDSLDVMLNRARRRKRYVPMLIRIQTKFSLFWNRNILTIPLLKIRYADDNYKNKSNANSVVYITQGDVTLILVSILLSSYGFAIGWTIGKYTCPILQRMILQQKQKTSKQKDNVFSDSSANVALLVQFYPVAFAILLDQLIG